VLALSDCDFETSQGPYLTELCASAHIYHQAKASSHQNLPPAHNGSLALYMLDYLPFPFWHPRFTTLWVWPRERLLCFSDMLNEQWTVTSW